MSQETESSLFQKDDRIMTDEGHFGFIRYMGPVQGQQGLFYGIEWDDPARGKHAGTYNSVQYFQTAHPHSGSFLPQNSKKLSGKPFVSFLEALQEKYLEDQPDDGIVTLGANKKIEVETVGWDKIKEKQKQLERLFVVGLAEYRIKHAYPFNWKEAPLDNESNRIALICPRIQDLDLSRNLFTCPSQVADITRELSHLESLRLTLNRFVSFPSHPAQSFGNAFKALRCMTLNATLMTWDHLIKLQEFMPCLYELHFGYNQLERLGNSDEGIQGGSFTKQLELNLMGCRKK